MTIPVVLPTVALVIPFELHVPPVEGVKFPVEPKQIEAGEVTVGKLLIVTAEVVALQLPDAAGSV